MSNDSHLTLEQKVERYRLELERFKVETDGQKPLVEGGLRFAEMAIRSLLLLNGGAAVAMLTFVGNVNRMDKAFDAAKLKPSLIAFGIGAMLSIITAFASYVSQMMFVEIKPHETASRWGGCVRLLAVILGFASLGFFGLGLHFAARAL